MDTTDERPACPVNAWCAFDPGHEGECSLIRPRQMEALADLGRELEAALQEIADAWREAAPTILRELRRIRTQQDFTLHPPAVKCEDCLDTGRITCGHPQCIGIPPCGDPCPHPEPSPDDSTDKPVGGTHEQGSRGRTGAGRVGAEPERAG